MKERQRQWHFNQSKRTELNETNLTNLTNLSEARSLKKYAGNKTLRNMSNKHGPLNSSAKDSQQQYLTERSNKQAMLHRPDIENSLSYRILNEILNSPEVSGNYQSSQLMHYRSLEKRSQPQPFDCSEVRGNMVVVDQQDQTFSRVVDQGTLMAREDYRSWQVERSYHITRLDEVEFSLERIAENQDEYFGMWSTIHETNEQIKVVEQQRQALSISINKIKSKINTVKDDLYRSAKDFIGGGLPTTEVDSKTRSVNRIVEAHELLASKVASKSFMESLTFSVKVLLPTHLSNPTLFVLYTKLLQAKLAKKLGLLLKKEANGLNPRDVRTVQQFVRVLAEEEVNYSKKDVSGISIVDTSMHNQKSEAFHLHIAQIVERTQHYTTEVRELEHQSSKRMQVIDGLGRQIKLQKGLISGKVRQQVQQLTAAYHKATRNGGTAADFHRLVSDRIEREQESCLCLLRQRSHLQRQLYKAPYGQQSGRQL